MAGSRPPGPLLHYLKGFFLSLTHLQPDHLHAMHIVLFRHGTRALFLRAGQQIIDCPPHVRLWLGSPVTEDRTTLTLDTPMPGIQPAAVLREILAHGFCALDEYGVVHTFGTPASGRRAAPDFLHDEGGSTGDPHG